VTAIHLHNNRADGPFFIWEETMTKPTPPKKHHPAKTARPLRKPKDGDEGFSGHVYRLHLKNWERRDQPDPTKRGKP
jgi:hypothetical protein